MKDARKEKNEKKENKNLFIMMLRIVKGEGDPKQDEKKKASGTVAIYKPKDTIRLKIAPLDKKPSTQEVSQSFNDAKRFFSEYIGSPKYMERFNKYGTYGKYGEAVDKAAIQGRKDLVNSVKLRIVDNSVRGSEYADWDKSVILDPVQMRKRGISPGSTAAHEMSHVAGAMPVHLELPTSMNDARYTSREALNEIGKRNKASEEHDASPWEAKADIDALRYLLWKDKIHDPSKEDFTPEMLKKAKEKYKDNLTTHRLFNHFEDEDLIWLMNNIAANDKKSNSNIS